MSPDEFLRVRAFHMRHMITYGRATVHDCALRYRLTDLEAFEILKSIRVHVRITPMIRRQMEEREILKMVEGGLFPADCAIALGVSQDTVRHRLYSAGYKPVGRDGRRHVWRQAEPA